MKHDAAAVLADCLESNAENNTASNISTSSTATSTIQNNTLCPLVPSLSSTAVHCPCTIFNISSESGMFEQFIGFHLKEKNEEKKVEAKKKQD